MTDIAGLTKIRAHGLKRKKPSSSVNSSSSSSSSSAAKRKRLQSDDTKSLLSLSTSVAYGAHDVSDDSVLNDDMSLTSDDDRSSLNLTSLDSSRMCREYGVLFSEDLTDDYEVWTMLCPDDVDINEFQAKSINFNTFNTLDVKNNFSNRIDLIPYESLENTNITIVVPSEETKKLCLNVVPLAGKLIISNRVDKKLLSDQKLLPVDTIEDAAKRRSQLMTKVTQRLSRNFDANTSLNISLKEEIKVEVETPKKAKKKKKST